MSKAEIKAAKIDSVIHSGSYEIIINQVNPMSGSVRHVSPAYSVRFSGDSTYIYLPYFGRVYSAPIDGEGGIKITNLMNNYKIDNKKSKNYSINFSSRGTNDTYRFSINVWTTGRAFINVTCNNRHAFCYSG
jgi:hypothetical protein